MKKKGLTVFLEVDQDCLKGRRGRLTKERGPSPIQVKGAVNGSFGVYLVIAGWRLAMLSESDVLANRGSIRKRK